MDNAIWTDSEITVARLDIERHVHTGLHVAYIPIVLLLFVFPVIIWTLPAVFRKVNGSTAQRQSYGASGRRRSLGSIYDNVCDNAHAREVMRVLVYTGVRIGEWQVLPRILPGPYELAKRVEKRDNVWPCARDEVVEAWKTGAISTEVISNNMLSWMLFHTTWVVGFAVLAA